MYILEFKELGKARSSFMLLEFECTLADAKRRALKRFLLLLKSRSVSPVGNCWAHISREEDGLVYSRLLNDFAVYDRRFADSFYWEDERPDFSIWN